MSYSNRQALPLYLLITLILILLFAGATYGKRWSIGNNTRGISLDRELHPMAYYAERLGLRTWVNDDEDASLDDFAPPIFTLFVSESTPPPPLVFLARQRAGEFARYVRDASPVLNL